MQLKYVNKLDEKDIIELAKKIGYQYIPKNDYWGTDIFRMEDKIILNSWNGNYLNQGAFKLEKLEFNDFEILNSSEQVSDERQKAFVEFVENKFNSDEYTSDKMEYSAEVLLRKNNNKIKELKKENEEILEKYEIDRQKLLKRIELKKQIKTANKALENLEK